MTTRLAPSLLLMALIVGTTCPSSFAADAPTGDSSILPKNAELEELWNEGEFTEGVAVAPDGTIYFSDIAFAEDGVGRILKFDPKTEATSVFCKDSGKSNGLMFDKNGRLLGCCGAMGGLRALVEVRKDGSVHSLVKEFEGKRLNSPNDLVVHPNGSVYFTDPRYAGDESVEMDVMSVYRLDTDGSVHRVTKSKGKNGIEKPNGVHVSPDGKTLYVAETNNGSLDVRKTGGRDNPGRMTLNAFRIKQNGSLGKKTVLVDFGKQTGTDGMTIDTDGRIYAAVRQPERFGIIVYTPKGKELAYIPTPDLPTNCSFGIGDQANTLFVTAGKGLYRIKLKTTGFHTTQKQ
ncbi:SMP-30/gluconolactonase/LRE family protein [Thalassoroseus pseudoceratinae]|uniref:SMP-30/gluconolactonase/LRE family protein n=1 Tax=Thalassoroseus pseudoceratinae TaxID=2713176 RepID=UPI001420C213|nr:SMP-30/gluconolactonase/LRE family protein [Thalassoroseus pseudoceratinae]